MQAATQPTAQPDGEKIHFNSVAGTLYFAYEQLRNIAEYTEQHLILRATIERFLKRHMHFTDHPKKLGYELVEELTQERYLQNDSITQYTIDRIDQYVEYYLNLQRTLQASPHRVSRDEMSRWTVQAASVTIEQLLTKPGTTAAFTAFAYAHFKDKIDASDFNTADSEEFQAALYCAVHRALMKSDLATTRAFYIAADPARSQSVETFVRANRLMDTWFDAPLTSRLARLVSKNGAPLRIIHEVILRAADGATTITQPAQLNSLVAAVTDEQYRSTHKRLVSSIIRTLMFVFVTKALIGLLIEVPYDIWRHGMVLMLPLLINMIFPPAYMATAIWAVKQPDRANTEAIRQHIERILYVSQKPLYYRIPKHVISRGLNITFGFFYALTFAASFGLSIWILWKLEFAPTHMFVFFLFFSAVSFFRFRLIQQSRELDVNDRRESIFEVIGNFFYTPFIKLGEWLSARYKRLNVITVILDLIIEMPLKTTLRILQEWVRFMRNKREGF